MELNTASAAVSFSQQLEDDSIKFYETAMQRYPEGNDILSSFISDNRKNKALIHRSYYGVISDALEGCFAFEDIDTDDFSIDTILADDVSFAEALNTAIAMEEKIMNYYSVAAEASRSLMADVPRAFEKIAKKRHERIHTLRSLLARS